MAFYFERKIKMNKREQQWDMLEKAGISLKKWSKKNNIGIYAVHFIPTLNFSLEVFIFYKNDIDVTQNQNNGTSERVKQFFLKALQDINYMDCFNNNISFIFDSNENVINNYEGSYFFRLR